MKQMLMIQLIRFLGWWHYVNGNLSKRLRLELWAYDRGYLEMWPGRDLALEHYRENKLEMEWQLDEYESYARHQLQKSINEVKKLCTNGACPTSPSK